METPQLKLPEDPVTPEKPWADDALGRKSCAKTLTKFLENQNAALTISVNGAWGTGKTFFLSRWAQQLKNDGSTVIYFNAWKDDNLDDPLVAIVGQLWRELKGGTFKEFCRACKDAAGPVLKKVGLGVLKRSLEVLGVHVASIIENDLKTGTESAFDEYSGLVDAKENFRERLRELAAKVFVETQKPLVFIVDELDRCRPNFAIEVLERIKHLFDIEHIVFVLGIDREQLGHAICSVYGNIDVENYLHRFIDIDFLLPPIDHAKFFTALWNKFGIHQYVKEKNPDPAVQNGFFQNPELREATVAYKYLVNIFGLFEFSLREIEFALKLYLLVLKTTPANYRTFPEYIPLLVLLKTRHRSLYRRLLLGTCKMEEVLEVVFPSPILFDTEKEWPSVVLLGAICVIFIPPFERNQIFSEGIEKPGIKEKSEIISRILVVESSRNRLENLLKSRDFFSSREELVALAQKMDLMGGNI